MSILHHANGRPNVAKPVKTYLKTLKWEVLSHMPYSPDIAPSDWHLYRSMTHGLFGKRFTSYKDTRKWVDSWRVSKNESIFRRSIHVLLERWEKVMASDGQYFEWLDTKCTQFNDIYNELIFYSLLYAEPSETWEIYPILFPYFCDIIFHVSRKKYFMCFWRVNSSFRYS